MQERGQRPLTQNGSSFGHMRVGRARVPWASLMRRPRHRAPATGPDSLVLSCEPLGSVASALQHHRVMRQLLMTIVVVLSSSSCAGLLVGGLLVARANDELDQEQRRIEVEAAYRERAALEAAEIRRRWNAANPPAAAVDAGVESTLSAPPLLASEPARKPLQPRL